MTTVKNKTTKKEKVEEVSEPVEIFTDMPEMTLKYMGKKAKITSDPKKLNKYKINLTKLLINRKDADQRIRKLGVNYTISITQNDETFEFSVVHSRTNKIYDRIEKDAKKFKTIQKEIFNLIVAHATVVAKDNYKRTNLLLAEPLREAFEANGSKPVMFGSMHEDVYHASHGVSKSQLTHIIKSSFEHYEFAMENGYDSKALGFGRGFHSKLLTPKEFKKHNFVMPELDLRKKDTDKVEYNKLVLENAHKTILTSEEGMGIEILINKFRKHPMVSQLLREGIQEPAFYWKNKIGTTSRGKADSVIPEPSQSLKKMLTRNIPGYNNEGVIIDYKTGRDASKNEFEKEILNRLYHVQAAAYCEAMEEIYGIKFIFLFVVIEKTGPQSIAWFNLDEAALEAGQDEYYFGLCTHFKHSQNPELWKGYSLNAQTASIPGWGYSRALIYKEKTRKLMESIKEFQEAA